MNMVSDEKKTGHWKLFSRENIALALGTLLVLSAVSLFFFGCASPCTYQGKAVGRTDAEWMKKLGMDVRCPK